MDHIYNKLQVNRQSNHKNNCSNYPLWNHQIIFTTTELKASQSRNKLQNILVQRKQQEYEKSWNERIEPHLTALIDLYLLQLLSILCVWQPFHSTLGIASISSRQGCCFPILSLRSKNCKRRNTQGAINLKELRVWFDGFF